VVPAFRLINKYSNGKEDIMYEVEKMIMNINIPKSFLAKNYYNNNNEESGCEVLELTAALHKLMFFKCSS
jgi:hypothetical protein